MLPSGSTGVDSGEFIIALIFYRQIDVGFFAILIILKTSRNKMSKISWPLTICVSIVQIKTVKIYI